MKLDTSHWLEYRIGGLFELSKGTRLTKANMIEGDIRFVSAANVHNGVTAYIGNNERVHSEGTITVCYNGNGGTGKAFYQDKPYWASDDVHVLYPKFRLPETFEGVERTGLNATVGLFLASAIERVGRQKYGFTDKWKLEYMRDDRVKLPADEDGNPNWFYIQQFMEEVLRRTGSSLQNLSNISKRQHIVPRARWERFCIGELFTIKKGSRLTKASMLPGTIRFISSSAINNGCSAYIGNTERIHPGNTLSVCYNGSVGSTFYQDEPFWASDDVNVLYPNFQLTPTIAAFLIPLIKKVGEGYDYTDKWGKTAMSSDIISLPALDSGSPDWKRIEELGSQAMSDAERYLRTLGQLMWSPTVE